MSTRTSAAIPDERMPTRVVRECVLNVARQQAGAQKAPPHTPGEQLTNVPRRILDRDLHRPLPCPSELRPFQPCAAHNARGSGSRRRQLKRALAGRPRAYRTGLAAKVQPSRGRRHATVLVSTRAFESGRDDSSVGPSASAEEETIVTGVLVAHPATGASAIVASRVSPRTANSANM